MFNVVLWSGTRVSVHGRTGTIKYVRLGPPDYTAPEVYSVLFDDLVLQRPGYSGTIVPARDVAEMLENPGTKE